MVNAYEIPRCGRARGRRAWDRRARDRRARRRRARDRRAAPTKRDHSRFIESHVTSRWSTDTLGCRAGRRRARDRRAGRRRARDRRARLGCARDRRAASTRHSLNPAALSSSRFHKSPSHRTHEVALSTRAWWSAVAYLGVAVLGSAVLGTAVLQAHAIHSTRPR